MLNGFGFDEMALVSVIATIFLKKEQVALIINSWKKIKRKILNSRVEFEESLDNYLKDTFDTTKVQKDLKKIDQSIDHNTNDKLVQFFLDNEELMSNNTFVFDRQTDKESTQEPNENQPYSTRFNPIDLMNKLKELNKTIYFLDETISDMQVDIVVLNVEKVNLYGQFSHHAEEELIQVISSLSGAPLIASIFLQKQWTINELEQSDNSINLDFLIHPTRGVIKVVKNESEETAI